MAYLRSATYLIVSLLLASQAHAQINYTITNEKVDNHSNRTVEVELEKRTTKDNLEKIAREIYAPGFRNTLIGYRIQDEGKSVYWATTHYLPNLKIEILGSTIEQHDELLKKQTSYDGEIIGIWRVHTALDYITALIKKPNGKIFEESLYSDGSSGSNELTTKKIGNQTRYIPTRKTANGLFYTINSRDGRLDFWDSKRGNYYSAPRID